MCTKITLKGESPRWYYTKCHQETELLLIDCRPYSEYSKGHIEGAINISVPSQLMLRRLLKGNVPVNNFINSEISKQKFAERRRYEQIVVYDENSFSDNVNDNPLIVFLVNKVLENHQVCLLNGGFRYFEECFPHLCQCGEGDELNEARFSLANMKLTGDIPSPIKSTDSNNNNNDNNRVPSPHSFNAKDYLFNADSCGPIQIVPRLFLGNRTDATVLKLLQEAKITHILNVTHDLPNTFEGENGFTYLKLSVQDNWDGNLIDLFPRAFSFIDKALDNDGCVLVHCLGGISRSSTIIIGYLMLKYGYSLNEAYDHVKNKKSNIAPNFNFMGQLQDFEKSRSEPQTPSGFSGDDLSPSSVSSEDSNGSC